MELSTTLKAIITANGTKQLNLTRTSDPLNHTRTLSLSSGTGNQQANQSWHDQRTLQAGQFEDLDLAGYLADAFGDTVHLAQMKSLYVENLSQTDSLLLGAAASNPVTTLFGQVSDTLRIRPAGFVLLAAPDANGYGVTPDAADQLRLTHGNETSDPIDYRIIMIGITTN